MRKVIGIGLIIAFTLATIWVMLPMPVCAMTGSGTEEDPYMIYNATDLQNMQSHLSSYYELANDIDASCTETWNWNAGRGVYEGFAPISTFTGDFNGNGYDISYLYMDRYATGGLGVGLFGGANSATVQNVTISTANITGFNNGAAACNGGVLIGYADGCTVRYAITSGYINVKTDDPLGGSHYHANGGGLIGQLTGAATVRYCASYATVEVDAFTDAVGQAGGLVGLLFTSGSIMDSYARGDVTGTAALTTSAAGLAVTSAGGTIDNCYSTGYIVGTAGHISGLIEGSGSTTTDSFWDKETSGQATSDQGTGKTTTQMKTQSTFTDVGWNFNTIWGIGGAVGLVNNGYPYLLWWYNPYEYPSDFTQVVWFQPNAIIEGTELPNRAGASYPDGIFSWGANPAGIDITHGELIPEEEYDFQPIIPEGLDIIEPNPGSMTTDVCVENLRSNPLYPLVQILSIDGFLNERLVWLGLAWFILIASMFGVHLGVNRGRNDKAPQHFVLTAITGLALSILFYVMGIFPWWVILLMAIGLGGAIIWERQPVI